MKIEMNGFINDMGYVEHYSDTFEGKSDNILDVVCDWLIEEREFEKEDIVKIKENVNKGWKGGCEWKLQGNMLECISDVMEEKFVVIG